VLEIAAEEGVMGLAALGTLLLTVFFACGAFWRSLCGPELYRSSFVFSASSHYDQW